MPKTEVYRRAWPRPCWGRNKPRSSLPAPPYMKVMTGQSEMTTAPLDLDQSRREAGR